MNDREMLYDAIAAVIVIDGYTKRWKADWLAISMTAAAHGVELKDFEPGSAMQNDILMRMAKFKLDAMGGLVTPSNAEETAERAFGPEGEVAPGFMSTKRMRGVVNVMASMLAGV
jgi:hypothetical protein